MEVVNTTECLVEWTVGFQKDGREFVLVVAKSTYGLPPDGEEAELAAEQDPVVLADEFTGDPGLTAVTAESDFAHHKLNCDVLLVGSAYAPRGEPCKGVRVGLHVGSISKRIDVMGDRFWEARGTGGASPTPPQPFTNKAITYDIAYGGESRSDARPDEVRTYLENPIGVGFYPLESDSELDGKPLACTQEPGTPADARKGRFRPMAFSPVGRNFKDRAAFAGTYDEAWQKNQAPFFPDDFDYRHFQAAPPDQQMPYPQELLEFTLENLTPDGLRRFRIPYEEIPVMVFPHGADAQQHVFSLDTVMIEPDRERVSLVRRLSVPLRKSAFDLKQIVVGQDYRQYRREMRKQKRHYAGLDKLIKAKRPAGS